MKMKSFKLIFYVALVFLSGISACAKMPDIPKSAAPLPEIAKGPSISRDKGYHVEEIADGLYWVTNGVYITMFLVTGEGVIVVDAPPMLGDKYLKAIQDVTNEKITHVIYSHPHSDHISGASMFPPDAVYIAQEETAKKLSQRSSSQRKTPFGKYSGGSPVPLPTVTFSEEYTLEVGNQILELSYRGINHEPGNIFIYAPKQKTLMLVDVVDPGWIPFKNLAHADNTLGYVEAYREIMSYDYDTFIGGHLNRPGTRTDVELHGEYMSDLEESAGKAIEEISFSSVAKELKSDNPFLLFDTYLDRVAEECAKTIIPKWTGRLGGADIFSEDNCSQMISSLRLE